MIKDFDTFIEEGRMGKLIDDARNNKERKEDRISNIKDIHPVDIGHPDILIADKPLLMKHDGVMSQNISYDAVMEFIDGTDGWRLPTVEELRVIFTSKGVKYIKETEEIQDSANRIEHRHLYLQRGSEKIYLGYEIYAQDSWVAKWNENLYYVMMTSETDGSNDIVCNLLMGIHNDKYEVYAAKIAKGSWSLRVILVKDK